MYSMQTTTAGIVFLSWSKDLLLAYFCGVVQYQQIQLATFVLLCTRSCIMLVALLCVLHIYNNVDVYANVVVINKECAFITSLELQYCAMLVLAYQNFQVVKSVQS